MRTQDTAENVRSVFGGAEILKSLADNETAFITEELTASEAAEKSAALSGVITSIRVFD